MPFFETDSIRTTGNINSGGNVVAAYLYGDGGNLTGIAAAPSNEIVNGAFSANINATGSFSSYGTASNINGVLFLNSTEGGGFPSIASGSGFLNFPNGFTTSAQVSLNGEVLVNGVTTTFDAGDFTITTAAGTPSGGNVFTFTSSGNFYAGNIGNAASYLYGDAGNVTNYPVSGVYVPQNSGILVATSTAGPPGVVTFPGEWNDFFAAGRLISFWVQPGYNYTITDSVYDSGSDVTTVTVEGALASDVTGGNAYVTTNSSVQLYAGGNIDFEYYGGPNAAVFINSFPSTEPAFELRSFSGGLNANTRYGINTTSGPYTVTLPTSASPGTAVFIMDSAGTFASNNLTVDAGNRTIMGGGSTAVLSTDGQSVGYMWNGSTWRTYT